MKKYPYLVLLFLGIVISSFTIQQKQKVRRIESMPLIMFNNLDSPVVGISYSLVPRNVNAPFSVFVEKIRQDNKLIGTIHDGKKKNWEKASLVYEISLPNGTKIAEAAAETKDAQEVIIWTFRDNKKQKVPMYKGTLEMDLIVAKYLIEKGYL
jgi:hypothetical protein